ncbi:MAG: NYN domain-containing protein [Patescibacteria group bacterium]
MRVFAFIDSQDLNLGVTSQGWKLDYKKFRQYLREKYGVSQAYLFIGYKPGNERLYTSLQRKGYVIIFKPTLEHSDGTVKGNVDAELVLHAMLEYPNYDQAIIVSGDGDFYCLAEYLAKQRKLSRIIVPNRHFSGLLRRFFPYIVRVDRQQDRLEFKSK